VGFKFQIPQYLAVQIQNEILVIVAGGGKSRLAAAASRYKMDIDTGISPCFGCDLVARGSSGLKPLRRRAPRVRPARHQPLWCLCTPHRRMLFREWWVRGAAFVGGREWYSLSRDRIVLQPP